MKNSFSIADLFCGVGGLSQGFLNAGFEIAVAIDNWEEALDVYRANFNHKAVCMDLSRHKAVAEFLIRENVDGIVGGPPCQDFSHAGKREEGARADLTASFAKIVTEVRPAFFVMENVARAMNSRTYAAAREVFSDAGYGLTERVLDASLCGVPQKRKRFFCIGILGATHDSALGYIEAALAEEPMTMRQYFGEKLKTSYYYRHPRNYSRRAVYSLDEPSATIRGVNRPIPPNYPGNPADAGPISMARPLTTEERAQVQTFPENFLWRGAKTHVEQMIGNAVPVNLGKFVAEVVSRALADVRPKLNRSNRSAVSAGTVLGR